MLIKNIYTLLGSETLPSACYILRKCFLLPVTYFRETLPSAFYILSSERLPSTCYLLSDESLETLSSACYILSRKRFLPPVAYFPTNTLPSACYIISDEYGNASFCRFILSDDQVYLYGVRNASLVYLTLRVTGIKSSTSICLLHTFRRI